MTSARLPMLSALAIARSVANGERTPANAIAEQLDRIDNLDERIAAFVHRTPRSVLAIPTQGRLAGIGLGVKDIIDTADLPTECGSSILAGYRPRADASVVAMARAAGATVLGKTVTTEFAYFTPGPTRNPWNLSHTPGGSSSGSAAAVAAGMIPFAIGTQTGGSVIRPAAFCGVAGYKPSFRLIPTVGIKCFSWALDTVGFFAASVADVAFGAAAISGRALEIDRITDTPPRFGVIETHLWEEASGAMHAAIAEAERQAQRHGAVVQRLAIPDALTAAFASHGVIQDYQAAQALAYEHAHHRDALSPILRDTLDHGRSITPDVYDNARRTARRARMALADLFWGVDVLLTPSAPGPAPAGLLSTGSSIFNRLWTLLGVPCVNVPGLRGADGLPLGVQVIAPFGHDRRALEAADWLERRLNP
jgi:Asp-tRNA(Asn)/Glu-tRNA(Gln) amidotransferase A subunit family amidase